MQLYSKREKAELKDGDFEFITSSLRTRLIREIDYISSTNEFLEPCFLVRDEGNSRWFLRGESMSELTTRELGYDITNFLDFRYFGPKDGATRNDYVLFDLVEVLLIFSKEEFRKIVRERFQKHFNEEGDEYRVHDFLIAQKNILGLKPFVSFIREKILREKLEQYYAAMNSISKNFSLLANISADIIQFLFSSEEKGQTKNYSERLVKEIAKKCVSEKNIESFTRVLNETVKNAKNLNNEISNIRHTDRSTLLVDNPSLFRLIASNNTFIAELVIFSDPEKYFFSQKAIDFKNEYIKRYNIPVEGWVIKKSEKSKNEINIGDIPF